ncbi:MAG TPA: AsmA-like C-terminal region-containing protein [Bacteroidales bacterium]|jgi:hypothetical protein|nr:AsmA-like C-terminal region-containing protein [Bacteroidales bacterium]
MKLRKVLVVLIVVLSSLVVMAAAAGFTLEYLFNGKVKELFVRELNKQLATEVQVEGIKLSLFSDFPLASVRFTGVRIKETGGVKPAGNLLSSGLIAMKFKIPDLLRNRFSVHNISVADAVIKLHIFSDGTVNYNILRPAKGSKSNQFEMDIRRIEFSNVRLIYLDDAAAQSVDINTRGLLLKGRFSNEAFRMTMAGRLHVSHLKTGEIFLIENREVKLDAGIDIETGKGLYTVRNGGITIDKLHLNANGWVINRDDRKEMSLNVSALQSPAQKIISLIPEHFRNKISNYTINGTGDISLLVKGSYSKGRVPSITANISLNKGNIIHRKTNVGLQSLSFSAQFISLQDGKGINLNISNLQAKLRNGDVSGNISMQGMKSPRIKANIAAELNLADIKDFLDNDTITSLSGKLSLSGTFSGQIADIKHPAATDFKNSMFTGNCRLTGAEVGLKGYKAPVTGLMGAFSFNNNDLIVNNLEGKYGESDFSVKGTVGNLLARIFVKGERLNVNGSLVSEKTDWDEISTSSEGSGEYNFFIPGDLEIGILKIDIRNFHFRKFDARNLTALLAINNRVLTVSNILLQSMQGTVTGKAMVNNSTPAHSLLTCEATINKVNISRLFTEFGNFGNTDLVAENLDGRVSGNIRFSGLMFPSLEMDLESVKTHAELVIEDGQLVNYAPMLGLSNFLRVEDLKDIRFETLSNQVDIANQIIYIPVMDIKSTALNLTLMGTHTFDNELNYHFSIALADILASKFKRRNPGYRNQEEFGPVADDNRGRTMVYVSMTGTVDEPVFKYDKKAVREKISDEMQNQRSDLKQALNREFQWLGKDTLSRNEQQNDKEIRKKQEEGKFVIEWDDDERK